MRLTTERFSSFTALPDRFAAALEASSKGNFFLTAPWFSLFESQLIKPNEKLFIYATESAKEGAKTVLPIIESRSQSGRNPKTTSMSNYYSPYFSPVSTQEVDHTRATITEAVRSCLIDAAKSTTVDFLPLVDGSFEATCIQAAMGTAFWHCSKYAHSVNWYLPVLHSKFSDYLEVRPSRLKNTIERKSRSLEKRNDFEIRIFAGEECNDAAVNDFLDVYGRSWKKPEPFGDFIPELARMCGSLGVARLGILYLEARPVAAQFWIVFGETASIYKLAHDSEYDRLSVGTVLSAHMFEHAIEKDRVNIIDYLTGDDSYKRLWMTHSRNLIGLQAVNLRTTEGMARAAWNSAGLAIRRLRERRARK